MGTSRADIEQWFDEGVARGYAFMLVVTDTFDYEDYPIYAKSVEDVHEKFQQYQNLEKMSKVTEVYDLRSDKGMQLNERRAWHLPQSPRVAHR